MLLVPFKCLLITESRLKEQPLSWTWVPNGKGKRAKMLVETFKVLPLTFYRPKQVTWPNLTMRFVPRQQARISNASLGEQIFRRIQKCQGWGFWESLGPSHIVPRWLLKLQTSQPYSTQEGEGRGKDKQKELLAESVFSKSFLGSLSHDFHWHFIGHSSLQGKLGVLLSCHSQKLRGSISKEAR